MDCCWFLVQWGYFPHSGNTTGQTVNFNITFPDSCYSVVASRTDSGATSYWTFVIHTNSVTTNKFQCHLANNLYWIAFGKQQWGYSTARTATFPIAFASYVYAAVGCPNTNYTSATATGVHSLTLTGLGIVMHGTKGWYFVIGKQQWGKRTTDHEWNVTFPIAFAEICYAICVACHLDSDRAQAANVAKITTSTCQIVVSYGVGFWLAVGKQQWGKADRNGYGSVTLNYPIAFSSLFVVNEGRYFKSTGTSNTGHGIQSASTTQVVLYTGASETSHMSYIAIGR